MTTIDLIRIACIKLGELSALPKWRLLKKRKLIKECNFIFDEFFLMDIFDQANAIASIVLRFYNKSPDIINKVFASQNIRITEVSIEMNISSENYTGYVSFIPARNLFEIDIDADQSEADRYKFSYDPSMSLPRQLKSIWVEELAPAIGDKFYTMILAISNIINHVEQYSNIEFVND